MRSLESTSAPFAIDKYWDNQGTRPSSQTIRHELHTKRSSSDLKITIIGSHLYDKEASAAKRIIPFENQRLLGSPNFLSGSGDLVSPLIDLTYPLSAPPETSIVVGGNLHERERFTFVDVANSRPLFSVIVKGLENHDNPENLQKVIFCKSLNKLAISDASNGIIHIIDVNVVSLAKVYPVQLSQRFIEVKSLSGFTYQPSFSRKEFIDSFKLTNSNSYWKIDPQTGRISSSDQKIREGVRSLTIPFSAILKGGDEAGGAVTIFTSE